MLAYLDHGLGIGGVSDEGDVSDDEQQDSALDISTAAPSSRPASSSTRPAPP